MDGPLLDEQEKQVRFIQESAIELNEMVNDLRDLAKIEAGRISISPGGFELVDLFQAIRGMFKPLLTNENGGERVWGFRSARRLHNCLAVT